MFEELEEDSPDVTPDSPDRFIAWAIWNRAESLNVAADEAWAILHERYPDDPRFLLLNVYSELNQRRQETRAPGLETVWTSAYLVKKLERIAASAQESLYVHIRELVTFGGAVLADAKNDTALAVLRNKVGFTAEDGEPKRDDRDRAGLRLRRFEREVLKEIDERTAEGQPLGARAPAPASSKTNDWADAVSDKDKPRRRYAADARFERGELIEHPKFGVGIVVNTEPGKVNILFESGARKLVAGG